MSEDLTAAEIMAHLTELGCTFTVGHHAPCATSEESFAARLEAFKRPIIGAKAIALRVTVRAEVQFGLAVLRGNDRLSSSAVRTALKEVLGAPVKVSFASSQEIHEHLRGLAPGRVPPVGAPLVPAIVAVVVDTGLLAEPEIGFNAAAPGTSIAVPRSSYDLFFPASAVRAPIGVAS